MFKFSGFALQSHGARLLFLLPCKGPILQSLWIQECIFYGKIPTAVNLIMEPWEVASWAVALQFLFVENVGEVFSLIRRMLVVASQEAQLQVTSDHHGILPVLVFSVGLSHSCKVWDRINFRSTGYIIIFYISITAPGLAEKLMWNTGPSWTFRSFKTLKVQGQICCFPSLLVRKKQMGSDCVNPN